jgi:hypothetical protein
MKNVLSGIAGGLVMRFQRLEDELFRGVGSRRRVAALFLGVVLASAFTGCTSVTLLQPLPATSDATERARLEGEWIAEDQILYVRFGRDGLGQIAGVDWKDDRFRLETGEIIASQGGKHHYLSVRVRTNGEWEHHYYFVQYDFTPQGDLVLWLPDANAFEAAVRMGKLQGTVEKTKYVHNVEITSPPEVILAFLKDPGNEELFDTEDPMILGRLLLGTSDAEDSEGEPEGT